MLSDQHKRFISDNKNLSSVKIAKLIGCHSLTVRRFKELIKDVGSWAYGGSGIPFLSYQMAENGSSTWALVYKSEFILRVTRLNVANNCVDHLISCIENGAFNKNRIEHPYFDKLNFIGE